MIPSKKSEVKESVPVPILNLNKLAIKEPGVIENHMDEAVEST